ncbi:MAG: hypothetical protein ABL920_00430 [Methylotenera sp.]
MGELFYPLIGFTHELLKRRDFIFKKSVQKNTRKKVIHNLYLYMENMNSSKLIEFTQKVTQIATWATRIFDEKNKLPVTGIIVMVMQASTLIAALVLTFLALVLTAISAIYSNLKETK